MTDDNLPLYYLYIELRRQGWLLGIDDYLTALQLIKSGVIIGNSPEEKELEQLCGWLWAKTPQQQTTIVQLCQKIRQRYSAKLPEKIDQIDQPPPDILSATPQTQPPPLPPRRQSVTPDYSESFSKPATEVAQGMLQKQDEGDKDFPQIPRSYVFRREYFPVTERQMKQSWRSLRRLVREGKPEEIDIEGSIAKLSKEYVLTELVLRPKRKNRADLIFFVDQQGSMVPFHDLSRQLVETAQRGGKLRRADVYYFGNCPQESLFEQPQLFGKKSLTETLASFDNRAVALIISDGGAARGHKDQDRIEQTRIFLEQLRKSVRYCVWVNPMPEDTWQGTSAAIFEQLIPMYSLSRQGLNAAISVLRGRASSKAIKEE